MRDLFRPPVIRKPARTTSLFTGTTTAVRGTLGAAEEAKRSAIMPLSRMRERRADGRHAERFHVSPTSQRPDDRARKRRRRAQVFVCARGAGMLWLSSANP